MADIFCKKGTVKSNECKGYIHYNYSTANPSVQSFENPLSNIITFLHALFQSKGYWPEVMDINTTLSLLMCNIMADIISQTGRDCIITVRILFVYRITTVCNKNRS
ncbi:unnamed protein product [Owenia fusiformis]|uniref:Uncharacterized protein n=1 Tax=Owenia fusiformis TaxID=6347 RepID=A0A8J1UX28_OWEFU|nr:unnamed protein product [Owenia fusiformis]